MEKFFFDGNTQENIGHPFEKSQIESLSSAPINNGATKTYAELLETIPEKYTVIHPYIKVKKPKKRQGWSIHLSIVTHQLIEALENILPVLINMDVAFKIPVNLRAAEQLLGAGFGYRNLAKTVIIFPENDTEALSVVEQLLAITEKFYGPPIPTDTALGGVLYTRYESFLDEYDGPPGFATQHIIDQGGNALKDDYPVPYRMPFAMIWPFEKIAPFHIPKRQLFINKKYFPFKILKPDAKGIIYKAIQIIPLTHIRYCVIKEGIAHMCEDEWGRSIQDRLTWQYKVHLDIQDSIPVPRVYELFRIENEMYLTMEYIDGQSVTSIIDKCFSAGSWQTLSSEGRRSMVDLLKRIVKVISLFHEMGYVHRDLAPSNILVDDKNNVRIIDTELTYSLKKNYPFPAFNLPTVGFIAPEQLQGLRPTVKEDVYSLGWLLAMGFTGISPQQFDHTNRDVLLKSLMYYIGDKEVAGIILAMVAIDSGQRPELPEVENTLLRYQTRLDNGGRTVPGPVLTHHASLESLREIIQQGINGMGDKRMLSTENYWLSHTRLENNFIINNLIGNSIYKDFQDGISGIVILLAAAARLGFDLSKCELPLQKGIDYLTITPLPTIEGDNAGFLQGVSGISYALIAAVQEGLLRMRPDILNWIYRCQQTPTGMLNIANGIAGRGLALLNCSSYLDKDFTFQVTSDYALFLANQQQQTGGWLIQSSQENKSLMLTGFTRGSAGILYFLMRYLEHYPNTPNKPSLVNALQNGLTWLSSQMKTGSIGSYWLQYPKATTVGIGFSDGAVGITLTFIKAYQLFNEVKYKSLVEKILGPLPMSVISSDLGFDTGLTGLGEVFLQAYLAFNDQRWLNRAENIRNLLLHSFHYGSENSIYWVSKNYIHPTADLFNGQAGILHFLIQMLDPKKINIPIL